MHRTEHPPVPSAVPYRGQHRRPLDPRLTLHGCAAEHAAEHDQHKGLEEKGAGCETTDFPVPAEQHLHLLMNETGHQIPPRPRPERRVLWSGSRVEVTSSITTAAAMTALLAMIAVLIVVSL